MGFNDPYEHLQERYDPALHLPIRGKTYRIEPINADTGLFLQGVTSLRMSIESGADPKDVDASQLLHLDPDDPRDIMHRILGDTLDEMKDDGVDWEIIKLVTSTVIIWASTDRDTAELYWNNGGHLPKAVKTPQDRKAPAKSAQRDSTGTTSRKPAKKAAARGKSSSRTGR